MNIKQLRYFAAIAEEGQITAAARKLHISQPPLSYELAKLENELGVKLVDRNARGVTLTGAGEVLYERAVSIIDQVSAAASEAREFGQGKRGTLSIGTVSSSGNLVPSQQMAKLAADFPAVRFSVHEGNTFEVLDMLRAGAIDVGIVRTPFKTEGLQMTYAAPEPMVAVSWNERWLAGEGPVSVSDLDGVPAVMYRRFEALMRQAFDQAGCSLAVICMTDDARTALLWARQRFGVALVPQRIASMAPYAGATVRPIDCPDLVTRQALVWMEGRRLSPLAQRFIELFPHDEAAADA
jgi:DNA-binding transcriptional LysR family regulator